MTNLIVNGSFEDPTGLTPTSFGYIGQPLGWVDANGTDFEIVSSGHVGQDASDGTYWMDSDQVATNMDISQTVAGVQEGTTYDLSYDLSEWNAAGGNQLNVYWNGTLIHTYDGNGDDLNVYDSFTFSVVGQAGDNVLRFEEVGSANNAGIVIDNVSLVQSIVPCFATGTLIRTPQGDRPVEGIAAGDLVCTLDHGAQPVLWAGTRHLTAQTLADGPHLRPIRIAAGAIGNRQDLLVSPQHRLLTRNPLHLPDGTAEALITAKHLAEFMGGRFRVARGVAQIAYHHLLFEAHEILWANGAAAESMLIGDWMLRSTDAEAQGLAHALHLCRGPMAPCRPLITSGQLRRRASHLTAGEKASWRAVTREAA